jgi:type IV pilus assembly protein PilB
MTTDPTADQALPELAAKDLELLEQIKAPDDPPRRKRRPRLGEQLIDAGLIEPEQLQAALAHQKAHGGRLGSVLLTMGLLDDKILEAQLGKQLGLEVCEVESVDPPVEVLGKIPEKLIRRYEMVPLSFEDRHLVVGMTDPGNMAALDDLRFIVACKSIEVQLITETTFRRFLNTRFATAMLMDSIAGDDGLSAQEVGLGPAMESAGGEEGELTDDNEGDPPVVRLVNYLLLNAIDRRASDIHIEPYETFFRIRYRIDGRLFTVLTPPLRLHRPVVSRIKVISGMDIAVRRKPQDGHIMIKLGKEAVHYRVSNLPTTYGEKCVIRLLKKEAHLADLGRLGFRRDQLDEVKRAARLPQGLVLVTGPTGSGKTTTLHAMLNLINEPETNIVTVEDPVESAIPGINHVQVEPKGGVTFATALRSILRQDPDVVFVGEMRDEEVSHIAIKAALTGHLVLSTLHTNGVVETFNRLIDMNLDPSLLANSLRLVLAQRLMRRLCTDCSEQTPMPLRVVTDFGLTKEQVDTAHYREARGCSRCMDTGYRGRVAVYESIVPNQRIGDILRKGGDERELRQAANEMNVVWMYEAGVARALAGETTFDEVHRVLVQTQ